MRMRMCMCMCMCVHVCVYVSACVYWDECPLTMSVWQDSLVLTAGRHTWSSRTLGSQAMITPMPRTVPVGPNPSEIRSRYPPLSQIQTVRTTWLPRSFSLANFCQICSTIYERMVWRRDARPCASIGMREMRIAMPLKPWLVRACYPNIPKHRHTGMHTRTRTIYVFAHAVRTCAHTVCVHKRLSRTHVREQHTHTYTHTHTHAHKHAQIHTHTHTHTLQEATSYITKRTQRRLCRPFWNAHSLEACLWVRLTHARQHTHPHTYKHIACFVCWIHVFGAPTHTPHVYELDKYVQSLRIWGT
jgi:hypothetical protein